MRDYNFVEATTTYGEIHEDIEEEFNTLQLEINRKKAKDAVSGEAEISEETDALSNALSNLPS